MLAAVLSKYKGTTDAQDATQPFGGINIILLGDMHQFPPVKAVNRALFYQQSVSDLGTVGKNLYEQFTVVVELREQMRMGDETWIGLLQRLREGECDETDLKEVRKLLLTEDECAIPDFQTNLWSDAVLVTPRHSAWIQWNLASLVKLCAKTRERMYISNAEDTVGRTKCAPSMAQRVQIAGMTPDNTAKLDGEIELVVGMKAMVLANISTKGELANGTRGIVEDIVLDPRDWDARMDEETGITKLKYPPVMILFRPNKPTTIRFQGVAAGLIPISPREQTFPIDNGAGRSITVRCRQLPLTPAYAFTDYKSQGQMIEYVIVDMGAPPAGKLMPFHAYVALSRSRGRDNIRLLWNFDESLFMTHPLEDLRMEDERLQILESRTERRRLDEFMRW